MGFEGRFALLAGGDAATRAAADAVHDTRLGGHDTRLGVLEAGVGVETANVQTTSYVLVAGDVGKVIEMNAAGATTVTVPPNSSVAFAIGTTIDVCRVGAGTVTLVQGAGVILPNAIQAAGTTNRTITTQFGVVSLRKRATNDWVLTGGFS